ncbi:MAG: phosphonate metabolism protein/1,5-bisphosphokinase (PRPP-forming) PhnN [Acetobacteraceae bacterium]
MLVLVVGPSGAGKDTLLQAARVALENNPRFRFVRRVITRPADAGAEDHEAVSETEFESRNFALRWTAHGLRYGIPVDVEADLRDGLTVVANVSRGVIADAAARFPTRVIEITAPDAVRAERLAARGREQPDDVAARLARSVDLPSDVPRETVMNDGPLEQGVGQLLTLLIRATAVSRQ